MKTRFKPFVKYQIPIFVVIILFTTLFYLLIYEWVITPKYEEQVNMFFGVYVDSKNLETSLYDGYEETLIKQINVDSCDYNNMYYSVIFNTRGITNTDFIILPLGLINEGSYKTYFAALDSTYINNLIGVELSYYYEDENIYGINVTTYLKDYIDTNEDLYLFINKKSDKVSFIESINSGNDNSFICFKNIFSLGE